MLLLPELCRAMCSTLRTDDSDGDAPAPAVPDAREIITMRKREPQGAVPPVTKLQCEAAAVNGNRGLLSNAALCQYMKICRP